MSLGKVAVVGSGAIGSYYGGKLAASGQDVHFLLRSDLEAVRERGILLRSGEDELHLPQVQAAATSTEIGPSDLVLIALKTTSNDSLKDLIPPLLHDGTILLTLQNGLGAEELLAAQFGAERVMGALCFVCLNRVAPGVIEHYGHGTLSIGEMSGPARERTHEIAAAFAEAGIEAKAVNDLTGERWRKLVWNIPFNGLSIAAGGITVAEILGDENLTKLTRDLMNEVIAAATALGHPIAPDYADFQIERSRPMGPYKPSSLIDWLAGRAVEVDSIWAEPLRRAEAAGVSTPRLAMLHALLRSLTSAARPR